jgi:tetraacyldisaccharide 4'-kinase
MKRFGKLTVLLLTPLSWLWENVYRLRRSGYEYGFLKRASFQAPVISVGNLTFGGTGKTPMILWLADHLASLELVPVVLTRGYKGQLEKGAGLLKSGQRFRLNPHDYGDEPLMIAGKMRKGAVIVGRERARNLERFFPEVLPDVVLLDDGFQHLQIHRSFNIVLFDATMALDRYFTAPLGYLREGLSALKDADAIVLSRADLASDADKASLRRLLSRHYHHAPVLCEVAFKPIGLFDGFDAYHFRVDDLQGRDVVAVTAIASPESFYRTLESYGARIVQRSSFPDHHFFSSADVNELLHQATRHGAIVVCSEKDMVKLRRVSQDPRLLFLKVQLEFLTGEDSLKRALGKVLHLETRP